MLRISDIHYNFYNDFTLSLCLVIFVTVMFMNSVRYILLYIIFVE